MRKKFVEAKAPYWYHDFITVYDEWDEGRLTKGVKFKVKDDRGIYIFRFFAHNSRDNVSWIDCWEATSGEFRAFYADRYKGVYKEKVKRVKKPRAQ